MSRRRATSVALTTQAAVHAGVRVVSGLLSFSLFGLIARLYDPATVKHVYFFLFLFGFAASALRMLGNVSASLDARRTRSANLRRLMTALGDVMLAALVVVPCTLALLAEHVSDWRLLIASALVLALASLDTDMLCALFGRSARFAGAFALGSALAVALLTVAPTQPPEIAFAAILVQWLPASIVNLLLVSRLTRRAWLLAWKRWRTDALALLSLSAVALFDGIVLNMPFLFGRWLPVDIGLDVAVVVRLFSASLLFFPLVLHWSNSAHLHGLGQRLSLPVPATYLLLLLLPAMVCGLIFAWAYKLVANIPVSVVQMACFFALVAAYCVYASVARFWSAHGSSAYRSIALVSICVTLAAATFALVSARWLNALSLGVLQAGALLAGAAIIRARFAAPSSRS